MSDAQEISQSSTYFESQYSLGKLILIWVAVALPMPIGAFVVAPMVAPDGGSNLLIITWAILVLGMIWQFILSVILLKLEGVPFNWSSLKQRLWLEAPTEPGTGKKTFKHFWWLIPAFLFYAAIEMSPVEPFIGELTVAIFPFLSELPTLDVSALATPQFVGAWWLMALAIVSSIFNYLLGEELLFRGILLPKMRGVFGRWDWVANSVFFALYHLHRPTQMFAFILGGLAYTLPSRYFRSNWFAIILHGLEGIFLLGAVFAVVSGLAFS